MDKVGIIKDLNCLIKRAENLFAWLLKGNNTYIFYLKNGYWIFLYEITDFITKCEDFRNELVKEI